MTPEQFKRVEDLYFRLEPLPPAERARQLDELAGGDDAVRAEVLAMLGTPAGPDALAGLTRQVDRAIAGATAEFLSARIGQRVGRYEILRLLAQGGMGVIYLAKDTQLSRVAALKEVLPHAAQCPSELQRQRAEARALASVSHPNVATVFGLEEAHDSLFLAMEFVEGRTLSERLDAGPIPTREAVEIAEQIAAGVEAAHDAGIVHRDLKPNNVMLSQAGGVKVLDFGIARPPNVPSPRVIDQDCPVEPPRSTSGKPAYMSPEQTRGEPLDARGDLFSFGAIFYRCLTGHPAFDGDTDEALFRSIRETDPDFSRLPPDLPESLHRLLRRCLAKKLSERTRHAGDVRLELRDALERWDQVPTAPQANQKPWRLTAALAVATILSAVFAFRAVPTPTPAPPHRLDLLLPGEALQTDLERLQLALSPDGQTIVASCSTPAGRALWARRLSDGQWHKIEQTDDGHRPFFSPDSKWVGYYHDGAIHQHPITGGGEAVRVGDATNWYGASWADDGSVAYVSAWGQPVVRVPRPGEAAQPLTRLDTAGGELSHVNPLLLPGGHWLLYTTWAGGDDCDVRATDTITGQTHTVIRNASTPRLATTPRGTHLLFERASIILAVPFDVAAAKVTGCEVSIAEGVMNDGTRYAAYFDVAADGTLAYVPGASFTEQNRLAYVNADRSTTPMLDEHLSYIEPRVSPDGRRLFVILKGKLYRGYVYDFDRQTFDPILTGGDTVAGDLSPDGQTLAVSVSRDGQYGIDLVSLADGRMTRVFSSKADYPSALCWSPDGKTLTFAMSPREGAPRDMWLIDAAAGATPRPFVATPASEEHGQMSPNGQWLAYTSDVSGRREVYVASLPDAKIQRQVTFGGGDWPAYSPDGKTLYYRTPGGLVGVALTADGYVSGKPKAVYDKPFGQSDPLARDCTVALDGRPLIVDASDRRPGVRHLRVITNWHELLPKTK